jgi:CxxC-x17-CxxC domain-containing protein
MFQKETFEIKCSDCGKTETVSFPPLAGKPVYCRTCFSKYMSRGTAGVYSDMVSDPKQAWTQREGWQRRRKKERTSVF